jgi:short subunit dehydrogenase-like uncharacterized protein
MTNREFDLVIFGATSFVGKLVCAYLLKEYTEPNLSWAMAARSEPKLLELKQALGEAASPIPVIVADSMDENSLLAMCGRTAVLISTVGPYALYGDLLLKACVSCGTDYCDLTGEPQWIRRMMDLHEAAAQASGARIVNCCGFDSIPSDLGVKFLQEQAQQQFGRYCDRVKMRVLVMKGGASGGTMASGMNIYKEAAGNRALQAELKDPYSLCGENYDRRLSQHDVSVEYDEDFNAWTGPFVMAAINTRVVLRSNAIAVHPYGGDFYYDEGMLTGAGSKGKKRARRLSFATRVMAVALKLSLIRWFAARFLLPKPGEGPSPQQQENGHYDLRFVGRTVRGEVIRTRVTGDKDPGYGSTAKMLAQAGISLRRDVDKDALAGGFWTPATAFDDRLIQRLQSHAGMKFEILVD